jgi:hypothetical protein
MLLRRMENNIKKYHNVYVNQGNLNKKMIDCLFRGNDFKHIIGLKMLSSLNYI